MIRRKTITWRRVMIADAIRLGLEFLNDREAARLSPRQTSWLVDWYARATGDRKAPAVTPRTLAHIELRHAGSDGWTLDLVPGMRPLLKRLPARAAEPDARS